MGAGPAGLASPPPVAAGRRRDVQRGLLRLPFAHQRVADQASEKEDNAGDQDRGNALVDFHTVHAARVPRRTGQSTHRGPPARRCTRPFASIRCAHHRETTFAHQPVNPIVIIPARMASTRLPGKPLADIHGKPMIVHVLERGREADLGPVAVACGDAEIADAVRAAGGRAVLTDPDLPSGSDRVHRRAGRARSRRAARRRRQSAGRRSDDYRGAVAPGGRAAGAIRLTTSAPWCCRSRPTRRQIRHRS